MGTPARAEVQGDAARFYEDALVRFERKDMRGAIIQLRNVLKVDANRLAAHVLLGKALLAEGEAGPAEVAFQEAIRLGVDRGEVVVPLAETFLAQGKSADVIERAVFSPGGLAQNVRARLLLLRATAQADLGDQRGAMLSLAEARAADARSAGPWLVEAALRIRVGQIAEAGEAVARALDLEPAQPDAWYHKGALAHVRGDLGAARDAYDKALSLSAEHRESLLARAGLLLDDGQFDAATRDIEVVRRASPREPRAAYLAALLAERAGRPDDAARAYGDVVNLLDPVPLSVLRNRPQMLLLDGLAHYALGHLEKAKSYLEQFQRQQGRTAAAKLLARIHLREQKPAAAIAVLEEYLRQRPGDPQALTLLAAAHMAEGRPAKATALLEQALRVEDEPRFRTALGLALLGEGRSVDALANLEQAYRRDDGQMRAATVLVTLYLRDGKVTQALAIARRLVAREPGNAEHHNLLGLALMHSQDKAGAAQAFEAALRLQPENDAAHFNLVRLDMADSAFDRAQQRLEQVLQARPRQVDAMLLMAELQQARGRQGEVQAWLEKAMDVSGPRDRRAAMALIDRGLREGQPTAALKVSRQLASRAPDDVPVLLTHARVMLANGDAAGARTALADATRLAAFDPALQTEIARLQLDADNLSGAQYSLEKALSTRADHVPAMALMAEVDLRHGEFGKADARARRVVQAAPRSAVGHGLVGRVALAQGRADAAMSAFRQAHAVEPSSDTALQLFRAQFQRDARGAVAFGESWVKAHPRDIAFRRVLGDAFAASGQDASALAAYEALLKVAPKDVPTLNNLANLLIRMKRPDAVSVAERALALEPANPLVIDTLGWALHLAGQHDRALELLREARLREPGNAEIRYHLATVLAQAGRPGEAHEELKVAFANTRTLESTREAQALMKTLR